VRGDVGAVGYDVRSPECFDTMRLADKYNRGRPLRTAAVHSMCVAGPTTCCAATERCIHTDAAMDEYAGIFDAFVRASSSSGGHSSCETRTQPVGSSVRR
jgi:hypothetical protein